LFVKFDVQAFRVIEGEYVNRARLEGVRTILQTTPSPMFINGDWVQGSSGETIDVVDPANGQLLCIIASGSSEDVDQAVTAAFRAFHDGRWSELRPDERARALDTWANLVERDHAILSELESLQTGKPITEARGDVSRALDGIRFYAAAARNIRGETIDVSAEHHSYVVREPIGVVASIVPWNVPIVLTISKAAPALAAGNTVIVKPSQSTPLTALHLAKLWQEANLPSGVFNVINGSGRTVGEALCVHPLVTGITFTGGTSTGLHIGSLTAQMNKRIMLELGGKSPNIILSDADLSRAIPGAVNAIFYGQGQICAAGSRLLVQSSIYEQVLDGIVAQSEALRIGDPLEESTDFGSLASRAHRDDVLQWVERAIKDGAEVATGGAVAEVPGLPGGAFMQPTIIINAGERDPVSCEEVFGPVLVVQPFVDEADALRIANTSDFGLSAGVWTQDIGAARRISKKLQSGVVWVNDYGKFNPAMPFGGVKLSGSAHREWSHLALDAFLEHKSIWEWNG